MDSLPRCGANYVPLSPINFLKRAAAVYASRDSVIYEGLRFNWRQTYDRCLRLASSLCSLSIAKNDVVSVLAPNIPAMYEMHFAVPMAGAVLNTINTRLDASNVATILRHSEAKLFFVDYQFVSLARDALRLLISASSAIPLVIVIDDIESPTGIRLGKLEYEQLIEMGNPGFVPVELKDEWDPIALNYTSGTTSAPKGVVYSHRGAYLSTMSLILGWEMGGEPVYLWSLPMFHCNGWTFTWGVAARGGTNVCIRNTTAHDIYRSIALHQVTHMCCAPTVFTLMLQDKETTAEVSFNRMNRKVEVLTGGAPPPASLLEQMESLGFRITHAYGLTEATGPALVCEWRAQWDQLPHEDQAKLKARQGISVLTLDEAVVKDPKTMTSVPRDGMTMGEIAVKGSSVMKGYYKDPQATAQAFNNGWFWTGDVGVVHPDGYIEIKDRSKDVIISGGENISSVEVESKLYTHPRVLEAAVVAMPHPTWGESPCAFVVLKKGTGGSGDVSESDIIDHCRKNLPKFMVPKKVVFLEELPKTSTGKPLKFELRALAKGFMIQSEKACNNKPSSTPANKTSWRTPAAYNNAKQQQQQPQIMAQSRL
uniref:4-coumarate--CoA ligase n=1 Tax=Kalanchoe fedtschenkoi TaxID=63787 RepID=A0A7N0TTG8_KALFE